MSGLLIRPDNGKEINITSSTKSPSFLGRFNNVHVDQNRESFHYLNRHNGSSIFMIPKNCGGVFSPGGGSTAVQWLGINYWDMTDNNTVRVHYQGYINNDPVFIDFSFFEILPPQPQSFGIFMQDSTDWSSITDQSKLGFVTWRGTVDIRGSWAIPDVPNKDNCIVFINFDRADRCIFIDRDSMELKVYREGGSNDPINDANSDCVVNICVVSTGFFPPNPVGPGMVIRNVNSQNVFSSYYAPLLWRGNTVNFDRTPDNYVNTGVGRPMIPCVAIGSQTGSAVEGRNFKYACDSGMVISGSNVTYRRARRHVSYDASKTSWQFDRADIPLPVLDANDYF